jgi:pantoate--beta-alanine ligase
MREHVTSARKRGLTVGLVPTMGALHKGHGALMRRARDENGAVVATIFVNPTQFDRPDDFQKYPRELDTDLAFCERLGVDAVFAPDAREMYPGDLHQKMPLTSVDVAGIMYPGDLHQKMPLTSVDVAGISSRLEGEFRPGHFRGVATVVAKLFNIVAADRAYFGEKDAQQLAVIQKMAADLNFTVEIVPVPTVREPDGLAMSSRNQLLTPDERRIAPLLYQALCEAQRLIRDGASSAVEIQRAATTVMSRDPAFRIQYLEAVDPATFEPLVHTTRAVRLVAAVWLGEVRLIDNVLVDGS